MTKYFACHEEGLSWLILVTYETSFTMRRATALTLQRHQILCLPQKITLQNSPKYERDLVKTAETSEKSFTADQDPTMSRAWSENELVSPQPAAQLKLLFALIILYGRQHFALPLSFQISPNSAPGRKSDSWTSPHFEPARKSDSWT